MRGREREGERDVGGGGQVFFYGYNILVFLINNCLRVI